MTVDDTIHGEPRGSAALALSNIVKPEKIDIDYANEVYRYAPIVTIDPSIVLSQWHLETDGGTSVRWRVNGNPAGLLIASDDDPDPARWNGVEAARVHIWALVHACDPTVIPDWGFLPHSARGFVERWTAKYNDPNCPTVATIDDLNIRYTDARGVPQATWAWDSEYQDKIVQRSRVLFPDLPDQEADTPVADITYGAVPHPDFNNRIIPSSQNTAWNDLGPRDVKAVVWHRMLGSLWGTDAYFRGEGGSRAMTDYGVGVEAQDGAENDGKILKWNEPLGKRSPWANGVVSAPYGDGLAFVNRYGINGVNRYATAIEISGHQTTPLSEKSRDAIAGITAYWADQYQIPWDAFPMVPAEDRSFVCWHEEFTIGTGKRCPFETVKAETNALIERARAILKKYQTTDTAPPPSPPTYADPKPPAWLAEDLERGYPTDHVQDGLTYYAALRPYEAIRAANRLQGPDIKAPKVGPRLKVRETFRGMYTVRTDEGRTFVLTPYGTFVDIKALTPRVSIRKA
jgi:hypothetical protein